VPFFGKLIISKQYFCQFFQDYLLLKNIYVNSPGLILVWFLEKQVWFNPPLFFPPATERSGVGRLK